PRHGLNWRRNALTKFRIANFPPAGIAALPVLDSAAGASLHNKDKSDAFTFPLQGGPVRGPGDGVTHCVGTGTGRATARPGARPAPWRSTWRSATAHSGRSARAAAHICLRRNQGRAPLRGIRVLQGLEGQEEPTDR